MKKVLLYYPKIKGDSDSTSLYTGIPLSVLVLAANLDSSKYDVRIIDGRIEDNEASQIDSWIDDKVVCVGVSSITSYQIKDGLRFSQKIKAINPLIPIVWGGWHPSLMPEQTIENEYIDIVCIGQGESTFSQVVERLADNNDLSVIPNILFKDSKVVVKTKRELPLAFKNTMPVEAAYKYINMEKYVQSLWGNKRVIGYESSRGCPWNCRFCSIGAIYKAIWSGFPAHRVIDGLEHLYKNYNIDAIHFFDNNFFVDEDRALKISDGLIDKGIRLKWDGTVVVEQFLKFPPDYIERLKKSGFFRIIVGVESGDEDVLKKIGKKHCNDHVIKMVEMCTAFDLQVSLSFMVGFPWQPEKDFNLTINLIEKIKAINPKAEILLFIFSPYLGTPLFDIAIGYGMSFPQNLEGWANYTYENVNTPWISDALKRKINRYISFFGTKDMPSNVVEFFNGGKNISEMAQ